VHDATQGRARWRTRLPAAKGWSEGVKFVDNINVQYGAKAPGRLLATQTCLTICHCLSLSWCADLAVRHCAADRGRRSLSLSLSLFLSLFLSLSLSLSLFLSLSLSHTHTRSLFLALALALALALSLFLFSSCPRNAPGWLARRSAADSARTAPAQRSSRSRALAAPASRPRRDRGARGIGSGAATCSSRVSASFRDAIVSASSCAARRSAGVTAAAARSSALPCAVMASEMAVRIGLLSSSCRVRSCTLRAATRSAGASPATAAASWSVSAFET